MTQRFVSYIRVSTAKQGNSGLGLEAQQRAIRDYVSAQNGELILPEFVEVESGKRDDNRPVLAAALKACEENSATLLVAKLDRLSRDVEYIAGVLKKKVEVVAVNMPSASKFILHVMAAVAEEERQMISDRTKAALQAAKQRGVRLGNPRPEAALQRGRKTVSENAAKRHETTLGPMIQQLREQGLSLRAIAATLEERGIRSPRGKVSWSASMVKNYLAA